MACTFDDNSTDGVNWGSNAAIDGFTVCTIWAWIYPTSFATPDYFVFFKGSFGGANKTLKFGTTNGRIGFEVSRATTDSTCVSSTTYPVNSWYFLAATYDESGSTAGTTINTYKGTLSASVTENSYSSRIQGSGATGDESADDMFAPNYSGGSEGFAGRIAWMGYINKYLSVGELQALQWRPHVTPETKWFCRYDGTGNQTDYSGNGQTGTEVGTITQANHVPIPDPWTQNEKHLPYEVSATSVKDIIGVGMIPFAR